MDHRGFRRVEFYYSAGPVPWLTASIPPPNMTWVTDHEWMTEAETSARVYTPNWYSPSGPQTAVVLQVGNAEYNLHRSNSDCIFNLFLSDRALWFTQKWYTFSLFYLKKHRWSHKKLFRKNSARTNLLKFRCGRAWTFFFLWSWAWQRNFESHCNNLTSHLNKVWHFVNVRAVHI